MLAGVGLMGGTMIRDFAITATAFGVHFSEIRKAGLSGIVSLLAGVVLSFVVGATVAAAFGYDDAVSMATIGAGAVTYIVGPVTGAAIARLKALQGRVACWLDIQIDTGTGGFALNEWLAGRRQVLLKTAGGPLLVEDPWRGANTEKVSS